MAMKCDNCIHKEVCEKKPPESYPQFMIDIMTDKCEYYTNAADVQPVVRCKNCKYLEISGCYGECGKGYLGIVRPDCYCCYGERRFDNG